MNNFFINPFTKKLDSIGFSNEIEAFDDTADEILKTIASIKVLEKQVVEITVDILGIQDDGSNRASYKLNALFYRNESGDITQEGSTWSINSIESDATWDAQLVANIATQSIDIKVKGKALTDIKWKTVAKYNVIQYP